MVMHVYQGIRDWVQLRILVLCLLLCGRWAAALAADELTITVTGGAPNGYAVARAAEIALQQHYGAKKPCCLTRLVLPETVKADKSRWALARIRFAGDEPTASQLLPIRVQQQAVDNAVPTGLLLVSNAPERVAGPRTLFEARLSDAAPARLLFHHKNTSANPLGFVVELLNPAAQPVRVQIIDAVFGPSTDEIYIGHLTAKTFAEREGRNAGYVLSVPPHTALAPMRLTAAAGEIVSGLARIRLLAGPGLVLRVRTLPPQESYVSSPLTEYIPSSVYGDYQYPTTRVEYRGTYTMGQQWLFLPFGSLAVPATRPGQELRGSYGVWHTYRLQAINPLARPVTVQLVVQAAGGAGRLVYQLGGQWQETGLLQPWREAVLTSFRLPPGESRTTILTALPQSGSYYPMYFVLRAVP